MPRSIKVLIAKDPISLQALADQAGWTISYPIETFDDLGSDYHPNLGSIPGVLRYLKPGCVALAYKDA